NSNNALKWEISGNFTTINNKVEGVGNRGAGVDYIQQGNTRTKVGRSMGEWFLIRTDGLFRSQSEIDNYVNADGIVIQPAAKPGDVKYVDKNGDGTINVEDRDFVGSPWPNLQAGMQFAASYKQFTLNLQFVGVFGYTIYNDVRRALDSYQRSNFRSDISPWSESNTSTSDPRIGLDSEQGIIDNNRSDTDRWLDNASYVRLRNIELGYKFPSAWLNRLSLQQARIYISAQNLFTITKYDGLDPDVVGNTDPNNPRGRILERGVDFGNWPSSRMVSVGLQCEF
ncbi:MAG TPA: SusC/RagA family TonB-linked outer membrane protein, partial [Ohtaekwangia sp.]|nr:SusC/RagA family TonB-linked outer membrane protein [Ohtaekwangia sp.]